MPGTQRVIHPLEPVFDERSRVLILGTMPSPASRSTAFYYGHPQNRFWKVLARLVGEPVAATNDEKRAQVLRNRIALWDVLASCEIEGASDASIRDARPNDLRRVLDAAPIQAVFCSGAKAHELYVRHCEKACGMGATRLPSTSPANAAWDLDRLVQAWSVVVDALQEGSLPSGG